MSKVISTNAASRYLSDYQEYALYVERHRTTPEFRDGLKPVQRRIIYAAYAESNAANTFKKSSLIIGDTMGHFHPHGDSSIEGALYKLVNWYQTKIPLLEGQGSFGNITQNTPAAPRYTEVKLSQFTKDCILSELSQCKEVVDWTKTYGNNELEPMYLPVKVPLLLINGSAAISVGDRIDIPAHNLVEVLDATINLIKHPNAKVVLIPDHCQQCEIVDTDWADICSKGYGTYKIRGKIDIEPYSGPNSKYNGYMTLVIKSCPDLTFLNSVIDKIDQMVKNNKIVGIVDLEDQSTDGAPRHVIVVNRVLNPEFVRNEIYKNTSMMQTNRINLKVLDFDDTTNPTKRMSYKGLLSAWIEFRKLTKQRLFQNLVQELYTRLHKISLYISAIESGESEAIINIIRANKYTDDAQLIETLIRKCKIIESDIQAQFFINCEIKKLSKGYLSKYKEEQKDLESRIKYYEDAIMIDGKIESIIIEELEEIKRKYGKPRQCNLIKESDANGVSGGKFKIVITENNFIKKLNVNDNIPKSKDKISYVITGDNSKSLLLFDSIGKVYKMPINKIPFAPSSNGMDIRLLNKYINAKIITAIYEDDLDKFSNGIMVTLTKQGYIKKITVDDFTMVPSSGLVYCKLGDDDNVIDIILFQNDNGGIIVHSGKKALIIDLVDIPLLKRNARGCLSMNSNTVTEVDGLSVLPSTATDIVVVTKNGYFNRLIVDSINRGRTKAGNNVIKLGKTDNVIAVIGCSINDTLSCLTTTGNNVIVNVSDIPQGTTISSGVKLIKDGSVIQAYKNWR